jgi:hypothetical protein
LAGGDEAALFVCPGCGQVHEVGEGGLSPFAASTAAVTTELAVSGPTRYLAVWRLLPDAASLNDPVWEHIRRIAAPGPAYLYVPAFSMMRSMVQRVGVRLTEVQPALQLTAGAPAGPGRWPVLAEALPGVSSLPAAQEGAPGAESGVAQIADAPGSEADSSILIGRREAWGLAHFVYMAIEAREARDLRLADLCLEPGEQELVFLPAVWDPRYIHESNWRLLLREFDGLVA